MAEFDKELNKGSAKYLLTPARLRYASSFALLISVPCNEATCFANLASAPAVKKSLLLETRRWQVLYPKPTAYSPKPNVVALPVIALADKTLFLILTTGCCHLLPKKK